MTWLDSILGKIRDGMQKHESTNEIYYMMSAKVWLPLRHYLYDLRAKRYSTQRMENEKQFFSEHAQELKIVYDSLENDKSRSVFENILRYRVTLDWAYLRKRCAQDDLRTQYFVPELRFSNHEVIVDCGAYTGDTAKLFYKKIPGCRVIALEPDESDFEVLQKLDFPGLKPIKSGAWSKDTTLRFSGGGGTVGGAINASGNDTIEVKALDHILECQSATYIKMDIEGAELEAIKGAENIIKERKPKLAICLYHKPQDYFEIPLYIKKLNPDYKLFVHHHHVNFFGDTVLYAI